MRWINRDEPTPLIDVLLVLIITLIVTMPLMTHAVKIETPGGVKASQRPVVNIAIDFHGTMYWNDSLVADFRELESRCRSAAGQSTQPMIRVQSDRRAKYDTLAKVLSIAQRSGIRGLGVVGNERFVD
jgi:biopolymer transport protein ExbD